MAENLTKLLKQRKKNENQRYSPYFPRVDQEVAEKATSKASEDGKATRRTIIKKKRKFGDKTEEEVMELLLPDRLGNNLDILFVGINPGLFSAYKGHHYCGPNNHFWPCLVDAGLLPKGFTFLDDYRCLSYGIGLTNIVARTTRGSSDLSRAEIKEGKENLIAKINYCKPLVVCFNGKGIYEIFSGKKCVLGRQDKKIADSVIYVMPSSSARTSQFPRKSDKLRFYAEIKELRDELKNAKIQPD